MPAAWTAALDCVLENSRANRAHSPSLMLCGPRNVGKSTLARHSINRLLNRYTRVAFLETDLGQCEFTPAGFVSLSIVTRPVCGPPHTHLRAPLRAYYVGDAAATVNPTQYRNHIVQLCRVYLNLLQQHTEGDGGRGIPIIINTPGWIEGLGLELLRDTLLCYQPKHIFEFLPLRQQQQQQQQPLSSESQLFGNVAELYLVDHESEQKQQAPLVHSLPPHAKVSRHGGLRLANQELLPVQPGSLPSVVPPNGGVPASRLRALALTAYFGKRQTTHSVCFGSIARLLAKETPYRVAFADVLVAVDSDVTGTGAALLDALNATMVGLCAAPQQQQQQLKATGSSSSSSSNNNMLRRIDMDDAGYCECFGLGIIRGIDAAARCFYVLTPLPRKALLRVGLFVKGNAALPATFLYQGAAAVESAGCEQPYTTTRALTSASAGASAVSSRTNLKRRRLHN
jgi:polynucleotide 5'-hydroxyl-kinase GRC3/NOL9